MLFSQKGRKLLGLLFITTLNYGWEMITPSWVYAQNHWQISQSNPLCYLETSTGNTIDLTNLCGRGITSPTSSCVESSGEKVVLTKSQFDGNLFQGSVINKSCKTVKSIKVNYEVSDESGNLIDTGYIYAQPATLEPGKLGSFETTITVGTKVKTTYLEWKD